MSGTPEDILRKYWGYDTFRPCQREIIGSVLAGRDTLGLLPTGGGKSITFQVPALMLDGLTVVVTPLISLMKDQVDNLKARHITAGLLHSGLRHAEARLTFDRCRIGKAKILYVSPERLMSESFRLQLAQLPVRLIVVDEAHCISQWGYDFRPSYLHIARVRELFPDAPVLALTASATPRVIDDIRRLLCFRPGNETHSLSFRRHNLSYVARYCDFKEEQLIHILQRVPGTGIVYTRSRKRTRQLAELLVREGISADYYHAGLAPEEKNQRQNSWKSGETRVIVATNAFGMGIDKPDVRVVIHYDIPSSLEEYYQEAGRAGRDGLPSFAVILAAVTDKALLTRRLGETFPPKEFIRELYDKLAVYLSLGMGDGEGRTFELDPAQLAMRFRLRESMVVSALQLLTRAGYIDYTEETYTGARIMMTMTRRELYGLRLPPVADKVLHTILRSYTGIFADYEFISENQIASRTVLSTEQVLESLLLLGRMKVLSFIPRRSSPHVYFPISRQPSADIRLPREIYEQRRALMQERLKAMSDFVFSTAECREAMMLRYFGQEANAECGRCDVCRNRRKKAAQTTGTTDEDKLAADAVIYRLSRATEPMDIAALAAETALDPAVVARVARALADCGRIIVTSGNRLSPVS